MQIGRGSCEGRFLGLPKADLGQIKSKRKKRLNKLKKPDSRTCFALSHMFSHCVGFAIASPDMISHLREALFSIILHFGLSEFGILTFRRGREGEGGRSGSTFDRVAHETLQ